MLWVCIWGMPELSKSILVGLTKTINQILEPLALASSSDQICVFYQKDLIEWGLVKEILIELKGCDPEIIRANETAICNLVATVKDFVPNCKYVEFRAPLIREIVIIS